MKVHLRARRDRAEMLLQEELPDCRQGVPTGTTVYLLLGCLKAMI